jgi:hypothetical protein
VIKQPCKKPSQFASKKGAPALALRYPVLRGFARPNLFPMRQFYEAYRGNKKVSALLRQLPWTRFPAPLP